MDLLTDKIRTSLEWTRVWRTLACCWHQQQQQELPYNMNRHGYLHIYLLHHRSRCIIDLKFTVFQVTERVREDPCSLTIRLRPSHRIGSSLLTFTTSEDWISDRRPHINYRPR